MTTTTSNDPLARKMARWRKRNAPFDEALTSAVVALGAKPTPGEHHRFVLETKAGPMRLSVDACNAQAGAVVYCRFDDATRGRTVAYDCNEYSGKWNHYFFESPSPEAAAACFVRIMQRVLVTL